SSETQVKRGDRVVGQDTELVEKLGGNDPCPCGSRRRFLQLLPAQRPLRRHHRRLLRPRRGQRQATPPTRTCAGRPTPGRYTLHATTMTHAAYAARRPVGSHRSRAAPPRSPSTPSVPAPSGSCRGG